MTAARRRTEITIVARRRTGFLRPACDEDVETLFDELIHSSWGRARWRPDADVVETGDAFVVSVDLPGVPAESIRLVVDEYRITVEGGRPDAAADHVDDAGARVHVAERPRGRFSRTVELRVPIDPESIETRLSGGVLRLVASKIKRGTAGARGR